MAQKRRSWYSTDGNLLLCFVLCAFSASASAQSVVIVPEVDSLCLWGTCTPPGFTCKLVDCGQRVDRVVIRPCGAMLVRGIPPNLILAHYDSMYFEIANTVPSNGYEIFFTNHSSFYLAHFRVLFDSSTFTLAGPCDLTLYVLRNGSVVDSAIIRFTAYQTGLSVGDDQSFVPENYSLFQNYPSPFNPSTTIRYGLPHKSNVTLIVFNTLGQRVATLVNETQDGGYHQVKFDGAGLSSGVYFYRLQVRPLDSAIGRDSKGGAGDFVQTRKLLLLR